MTRHRLGAASMGAAFVATVAAPLQADFVGWFVDPYAVTVSGAQYSVFDVYAQFNGTTDTVVGVFNARINTPIVTGFHQNDLATLSGMPGHWSVTLSADLPSLGVVSAIDSFVLIGGPIGSVNTTSLGPGFSPPDGLEPPVNADWFNSSPLNLQGRVNPATLRTWIGRFAFESEDLPAGLVMSLAANLAYNQGVGTPAQFAFNDGQGSGPSFDIYVPSPGALAVLAGGGLLRDRRRR